MTTKEQLAERGISEEDLTDLGLTFEEYLTFVEELRSGLPADTPLP